MSTSTTPSGPMQQPETWSAIAAGYAEELFVHSQRYAEEATRLVPPAPSDRVLDVAAGPGPLSLLVAPRVASVTAVDFSPGMAEQLRARAMRDGRTNVEVRVMDAQALELGDASFDAAYCLFAFMFFPDRNKAFGEIQRVLRPGGRALVATWSPIDRRPLMQVLFESMAEAFPDLPPLPKGDLQHPDECVREMSAAGFQSVSASYFTASVQIPSADHYLYVMGRAGAPLTALEKRLGPEAWAAGKERLRGAVRSRIPEGGKELSAEAIMTSGTR